MDTRYNVREQMTGCSCFFLLLVPLSVEAQVSVGLCGGAERGKAACLVYSLLSGATAPLTGALPGADLLPVGEQSGNSVFISQLTSSIPMPSPASGFTYVFDPAAGVYTRSTESFGPALTERAETIGKNRISFGTSFQRYTFDQVDGFDLHNFRFLTDFAYSGGNVVATIDQNVSASLTQYVVVASYGLTNRIDLSAGVPFNSIRIGVDARVRAYDVPANLPSPTAAVAGTVSANGFGDVAVQIKGSVLRRERAGIAVGLALRTPTGDEFDGLGAGAWGIRPFVAASYSYRRFAPHVNFGYEWNGKSILMGNIITGTKDHIPAQVTYAVGFDSAVHPRFTFVFDILGRKLINADRFVATTRTTSAGIIEGTTLVRKSVNLTNGTAGFKANLFGNLLLGANVIFRLNEGGFRTRVAPLFTLTYTL